MAISVLHWVMAGDQRLMRRVNGWTPPQWMRLWMLAATRGGDGWLWYAMALVVVLAGGLYCFSGSSGLAGASGPASWRRTAGPRCFRRISFPSRQATPLLRSR
jgi:hypothetical protein